MPENSFYPKDKLVAVKATQPGKKLSYILEGLGSDPQKEVFEIQIAFPSNIKFPSEQIKNQVKLLLGNMLDVNRFTVTPVKENLLIEIPLLPYKGEIKESFDVKFAFVIKLLKKDPEGGNLELQCNQEIQLQAQSSKPSNPKPEEKQAPKIEKKVEEDEAEETQESQEQESEDQEQLEDQGKDEVEEKDEDEKKAGFYSGLVAIDYGTTNSTVAVRDPCFAAEEVRGQLGQAQWQSLCEWMNIWLTNHLGSMEPGDLDLFIHNLTLVVPGAGIPECGSPGDEIQQAIRNLDDASRAQILQELVSRLSSNGLNEESPNLLMKKLAYESLKGFEAIIDANSLESQRYFVLELDRNVGAAPISSVLQVISVPASTDIKSLTEETQVDMGARVSLLLHNAAMGEIDIRQFVLSSKRYFGSEEKIEVVPVEGNGEAVEIPCDVLSRLTYRELMKRGIQDIHRRAEAGLFQDATWPKSLVATFPTTYPASLRSTLRQILEELEIKEIDTRFDEATAAAIYYIWREIGADPVCGMHGLMSRSRKDKYGRSYQNLLLYDLGGGTTDIALIQLLYEELAIFDEEDDRGNGGCYFRITPRLLGTTGHRYLGGDLLTLWFFRFLKSKIADYLLNYILEKNIEPPGDSPLGQLLYNFPEELSVQDTPEGSPAKYQSGSLLEWTLHPTQYLRKYNQWNEQVIDLVVPTRFYNDRSKVPNFFTLWEMTDEIKKALGTPIIENFGTCLGMGLAKNWPSEVEVDSGQLYNFIKMIQPWLADKIPQEDLRMLITQEEMNSVVSDTIKQSMSLAASLAQARLRTETRHDRVDRLILAGLSCNMKAVQDVAKVVFRESDGIFDYDPTNVRFDRDSAKTSVALGACVGRYMESVRVDPFNEKTRQMLRDGYDQIELVIENLFSYLPCRLAYDSLVAMVPIFEQGQELNVKSYWDDKNVARTSIRDLRPVQEKFWIYRIDFPGAEPQYLGLIDSEQVAKDHGFEDFRKFREEYVVGFEADAELMIRCFYLPKGIEITAKDFAEPVSQEKVASLFASVPSEQSPLKRSEYKKNEEKAKTEDIQEESQDEEERLDDQENQDEEEKWKEESDAFGIQEDMEEESEEAKETKPKAKPKSPIPAQEDEEMPQVDGQDLALTRTVYLKEVLDDSPIISRGERLLLQINYPDGSKKRCCVSPALTMTDVYEFNISSAQEGAESEPFAKFEVSPDELEEVTLCLDENQRLIMLTKCLFDIEIYSDIQFVPQKADMNYDPFCGYH